MRSLVLDTNVVLDLLVFHDPRTHALRADMEQGALRWLATHAMRDELAHVLAYPHFVKRQVDAGAVLAQFDARAQRVDVPIATTVLCRDTDDQKFIDLAVAHSGLLVSKDKQVLSLRKRLAPLAVETVAVYVGGVSAEVVSRRS